MVASVLAVLVAIYDGFSTALAIGAICYALVLVLALFSRTIKETVVE